MNIQQIASERLAELGCYKLPKTVRDIVIASFILFAESHFKRLAKRHITSAKIAKAFLEFLRQNNGGDTDYLNLPLQDETNRLAGTNTPLKNPPYEHNNSN